MENQGAVSAEELVRGSEMVEDKSGKFGDDAVFRARKEKLKGFFTKNYNWVVYLLLAVIVFISVKIRTRNLGLLKDITTGTWTLGPDLDPFLFLRWAKYIVENGSLFAVDIMRYVPVGYSIKRELLLHPYMIAWFHNIASIFGSESVTQSAVIYPVFFFAITVIAFFFLVRKVFVDHLGRKRSNVIALVASFLLTVAPSLLPRTIAGIPEKESAAFFFLFAAFYFFLSAWKERKSRKSYILALLAGVFTAGMALVWGGFAYIFLTITIMIMIAFLLGHTDKHKFYVVLIWLASSFALMIPFTERYTIENLLTSTSTGGPAFFLLLILVHYVIHETKFSRYFRNQQLGKIPKPLLSLIVASIFGVIFISIWQGPSFIFERLSSLFSDLIRPAQSRLIRTVAENRQPYFGEWSNSFGPLIKGIPIFFWLFVTGSVYLFFNMIRFLKKNERWVLTGAYVILLMGIIFSRYSSGHVLNGESGLSLLVYFGGVAVFLGSVGYYYFKYYQQGEFYIFKRLDFGLVFLLAFLVLGIVSARGAVRLILMLVPPTSMIVSYLGVNLFYKAKNTRDAEKKVFAWIVAVVFIIPIVFSGYTFYQSVNSQASVYAPSAYTQQWQKAMFWVRENVPEDAVFGHWWDYGYWIQSIGERATILDGGNAISYWNHLMGRYALTGSDERAALEYLYAHEGTHFLIDSTDIGKYAAFASIGSNSSYDRRSWINTFTRDNSQVLETKNGSIFVYSGGFSLDEDLIYKQDV